MYAIRSYYELKKALRQWVAESRKGAATEQPGKKVQSDVGAGGPQVSGVQKVTVITEPDRLLTNGFSRGKDFGELTLQNLAEQA